MRLCECGSFWGPTWDHEENCLRWPGSEWARDRRQGIGEARLPKTRAAFRNRAGIHARERGRRSVAALRGAVLDALRPEYSGRRPRPMGVPEPLRGRAARGLAYRVDSEGTDHTRRGWIGGPYNRKPASNPNKRRKRRRG